MFFLYIVKLIMERERKKVLAKEESRTVDAELQSQNAFYPLLYFYLILKFIVDYLAFLKKVSVFKHLKVLVCLTIELVEKGKVKVKREEN